MTSSSFKIFLPFIICLVLFSCSKNKEENILELALTDVDGYGPIKDDMLTIVSTYTDTVGDGATHVKLEPVGVPEDWTEVKLGHKSTNRYQSLHQSNLAGNLSKEELNETLEQWQWEPDRLDSLSLSDKAIKCDISFAYGKNVDGEYKFIIDANNNLDFRDDEVIDSQKTIEVDYERYVDGKIEQAKSMMFVNPLTSWASLGVNFPKHSVADFNGEKVVLSSENFTNLSYEKSAIALLKDSLFNKENLVYENEYFVVDDQTYKFLGVNKLEHKMRVERMNTAKDQLYSTQIGSEPFPIKGNDFKTRTFISLADFKGKYVLLDFWATWCGPCISEFPNLKDLYEKTSREDFEILGVVWEGEKNTISKIMDKQDVSWPQLYSSKDNNIVETYGISSLPATFLIGPDGKIIKRDIRGKKLEELVLKLIEEGKNDSQ